MDSFFITLLEKKQLTHDVYELMYTCATEVNILPGQFLLCDTDTTNPKLRRSYSISDYRGGKIHCIIKELANGKGGSRAICQQAIGHTMQVWGPMGTFVLPDLMGEKLIFIGTGTGFAPLYFQAKHILETSPNTSIHFVFGVREERDLFYQSMFEEWSQEYPHFSYQFCLSQGTREGYFPGRVTDYLRNNSELIGTNTLYSICGSPAMVQEVRTILSDQNIEKERVFFEQY